MDSPAWLSILCNTRAVITEEFRRDENVDDGGMSQMIHCIRRRRLEVAICHVRDGATAGARHLHVRHIVGDPRRRGITPHDVRKWRDVGLQSAPLAVVRTEDKFIATYFAIVFWTDYETSTNLPPDVRRAMARAVETETGERSAQALGVIATNIDMACADVGPLCQDTGWLTFEVRTPVGTNQIILKQQIREAVARRRARQTAPELRGLLTGNNSGVNLGPAPRSSTSSSGSGTRSRSS